MYIRTSSSIIFRNNNCRNVQGPMPRGQMIQVNYCTAPIDISCNISVQEPGESYATDQNSIHNSDGTATKPIMVKHNYINGGTVSTATGIITGDGGGSYTTIDSNVIVNPGNIGIGVVRGTGHKVRWNKIYGKASPISNVGFVAWEAYGNSIDRGTVEFTNNNIW